MRRAQAGGAGWAEEPSARERRVGALRPMARISALILSVVGSPVSILNREEGSPYCVIYFV